MGRPFILVTAAASMLMFAGVWTATAPEPVAATPEPVAPVAALATVGAVQSVRTRSNPSLRVAPSHTAEASMPYNVVRSPYGATRQVARRSETDDSVYYAGCREARAAGVTPLHRGSPGYREEMDGDGDGIACENYR